MERYKVEGVLEVKVATHIEFQEGELDSENQWPEKRRKIERLFREKIRVENFPGNGGDDKLIGVVGMDNSIQVDADYVPKLLNVRRVM